MSLRCKPRLFRYYSKLKFLIVINHSMKKVTFYTLAAMALVGCSDDEYLGQHEQPSLPDAQQPVSITFGAGSDKVTRATSGLETVTGTFKVYGTKGTSNLQVFNNYAVWHQQQSGQSITDAYYWEYVGTNGSTQTPYLGNENGTLSPEYDADGNPVTITLDREQQEKFWDYEQSYYRFWAIAPWDNTVKFYNGDAETQVNTNGIVTKAVLSNLGGHLNANNSGTGVSYNTYYVANPLKIGINDYNKTVNFVFNRTEAKVRVGIYETVPGYEITEIKFYQTRISNTGKILKVDGTDAAGNTVTGRNNIVLNRTDHAFVGNSTPGSAGTAIITYDNEALTYSLSYDAGTSIKAQKYFEAGELTGVPAITSTHADLWGSDDDMGTNHYFTVLPTPTEKGRYGAPYADNAKPIYLCCDFTLKSTDGNSQEEIHVKGATAVVPADYTTWKPNHAYTYLFKISRNTNGTTGDWDPTGPVDPEDPDNPDPEDPDNPDPDDPENPDDPTPGPDDPDPDDSPEGLFAITFDAVVEDVLDETEGTTTTFTTPSITTYQNGVDVTADGIIYKPGEDITFKVMENTTDVTSSYKVYVSQCMSAYNFNKTAEQNGAAFSLNTTGKIVNPGAGWYVIKAQNTETDPTHVAYKVIRVGKADPIE